MALITGTVLQYSKVVCVCGNSLMDFNSPPTSKGGRKCGGKVENWWGSEGEVSDPRSTLTNLHLILAEA